MSVEIKGNVAVNNETGQKYTYGKRGRKPYWVQEFENSGAKEIPVSKTKTKQKIVDELNGPFEWHMISEMNNQCVIVADSPVDALIVANRAFKTPLTASELEILWKKKPHKKDGWFSTGVWYMNKESNVWEEYKHRA